MALKPAKVITTDEQIANAIRRAQEYEIEDPIVIGASYSYHADCFILRMKNGAIHKIPRGLLQGLGTASRRQLSQIEIVEFGAGLYWPALDVAHLVSGVLSGVYGSEKWMRQLKYEVERTKIPA